MKRINVYKSTGWNIRNLTFRNWDEKEEIEENEWKDEPNRKRVIYKQKKKINR